MNIVEIAMKTNRPWEELGFLDGLDKKNKRIMYSRI